MAAYEGYVDLKYRPEERDIVARFYVEPKYGITLEKAASMVAAESSIGTWTDIETTKPYVKKLAAHVFHMDYDNGVIDIAYPLESFEMTNVPQIFSSIAGNVFGMKEINHLRLFDVRIPKPMLKKFSGPMYGIPGVRKLLKVHDRPLVGTIIKPKMGLNPRDHAQVAYNAWLGGCDVVKDDENLTDQKFNRFKDRFLKTIRMRDKAEKQTGEKKMYMVNVTAPTGEMIKRAKFVEDNGGEYAMVDVITVGFSGVQELINVNKRLELVLHAHRAMHAAFTRPDNHGISMMVLCKFYRMMGIDQLHIGTIVGKMSEGEHDVIKSKEVLTLNKIPETTYIKDQEWGSIKPVFPVASGGLHPGQVAKLMEYFGKDVIIQMGGGIHGNPLGTVKGATAARQAVDAVLEGTSTIEYARRHSELQAAIDKFGVLK